jgi:hypothetical protein
MKNKMVSVDFGSIFWKLKISLSCKKKFPWFRPSNLSPSFANFCKASTRKKSTFDSTSQVVMLFSISPAVTFSKKWKNEKDGEMRRKTETEAEQLVFDNFWSFYPHLKRQRTVSQPCTPVISFTAVQDLLPIIKRILTQAHYLSLRITALSYSQIALEISAKNHLLKSYELVFAKYIMCDFHLQQNNDADPDPDLEAWVNVSCFCNGKIY